MTQAEVILNVLRDEGYNIWKLTDSEVQCAIDTYGAVCEVGDVRNAAGVDSEA